MVKAGRFNVCPTVTAGGSSRGMMDEREVITANSLLIAAAPDLLLALEGMLGAWNMICDAQGWERDHIQQQKDAVAAIAKATGESK